MSAKFLIKPVLATLPAVSISVMTLITTPASVYAQGHLPTICRNVFSVLRDDIPLEEVIFPEDTSSNSVLFQISSSDAIEVISPRGLTVSEQGGCAFDDSGRLIKFDTESLVVESPMHFQDFGDISDVGRFIVLLREKRDDLGGYSGFFSTISQDYRATNVTFPVLVDNRREIWWSDCQTNELGRISENGTREEASSIEASMTISTLVCSID
ncbi:MAG: hypothetical protein HC899_22120 [Leptolyngbyaceae cyanobacterium SM1_4_3]|nr:hypothetical protein [Leptolyngbyaceae cyanobacterium SM1_4_3]